MKRELSILIPVYNTVCTEIVCKLAQQCEQICKKQGAFQYEIVVADDASPEKECVVQNRVINEMEHCRFIEKLENTGSAATRNLLVKESKYEWLLFLDCDMEIVDDLFIENYMLNDFKGVINGGIKIGEVSSSNIHNLRQMYEKRSEPEHTAEKRQKKPYHSFRSTNFLVEKHIMTDNPFDERFKKSGYEDVMLGKHLKERHIEIHHIENPTLMNDFEENADYMAKIEHSLTTLYKLRTELRGYSKFITIDNGIHLSIVKSFIRLWHRAMGAMERRNLCSSRPSLHVFDLYRLGFYLSLTKKD